MRVMHLQHVAKQIPINLPAPDVQCYGSADIKAASTRGTADRPRPLSRSESAVAQGFDNPQFTMAGVPHAPVRQLILGWHLSVSYAAEASAFERLRCGDAERLVDRHYGTPPKRHHANRSSKSSFAEVA